MSLSSELVSQFVKVTRDEVENKTDSTAYGTIVVDNDNTYVKLDGSDLLTPISTTTVVKDGDRVFVTIKNHSAIVTGNITNPSATDTDVTEIGNKISEFEIVIADKVTVDQLEAEIAKINKLIANNIEATNAKFETIEVEIAKIGKIEADNITINETLTAHTGKFETIEADIATFKDVTTENFEAVNANIHNLNVDYGEFKDLTTNTLTAHTASITNLETKKLDTETANITFANIDFSNIGEAAIEKLFTESGIIDDLTMDEGHVTGKLVGVTIIGDLIEGGTVKADKLVIKGDDGLYYKLNTNGETVTSEQTDYNSLNGSVITAKSITAEKVKVSDLVAFGATIGGFNIDNDAIYSGVKSTMDNDTTGIHLNKDGQINIGDADNYLKYYKDEDGNYHLVISAATIKMGSSHKSVEEAITEIEGDMVKSWSGTREEYEAIDPKDPNTYYYIIDDVSEYVTESEFTIEKDAITARVSSTETRIADAEADIEVVEENYSELSLTSDGLSAKVESVVEQQAADKEKIDGMSDELTTLSSSVEAKMSSSEVTIAIQTEMAKGVDNVTTKTKKFTFNDEGLNISVPGSMENKLDETGMNVNKINTDEESTKENILKADISGVRALNLESKNHISVAERSKFQGFVKNGEPRIGCFWTN